MQLVINLSKWENTKLSRIISDVNKITRRDIKTAGGEDTRNDDAQAALPLLLSKRGMVTVMICDVFHRVV